MMIIPRQSVKNRGYFTALGFWKILLNGIGFVAVAHTLLVIWASRVLLSHLAFHSSIYHIKMQAQHSGISLDGASKCNPSPLGSETSASFILHIIAQASPF